MSGNGDIAYNQSEISECTGLSRPTVNQKIPRLLYNGILEIKEKKGNVNYYQLANNKIIKGLIGAVFANSFFVAEYEDDEEEVLEDLKGTVGPVTYETENRCFCYSNEDIISLSYMKESEEESDIFPRNSIVWPSSKKEHRTGLLNLGITASA